jgi:transcriptional regulator with XRE-family HTH domain
METGIKLKEIVASKRKSLNLSQIELANKCGLTQSQISNFEAGKTSLSSDNLEKILEVLSLNYSDFETKGYTYVPLEIVSDTKNRFTPFFYELLSRYKKQGKYLMTNSIIMEVIGEKDTKLINRVLKSVESEIKTLYDDDKINFYVSYKKIDDEYMFEFFPEPTSDKLSFKEVSFFHDLYEFLDTHDCNINIEKNQLIFKVDKAYRVMPVMFDADTLHDYIVVNATKAGEKYRKAFEEDNEIDKRINKLYADNGIDHNSDGDLSRLPEPARNELDKLIEESRELAKTSLNGIGKIDYIDEYPELED